MSLTPTTARRAVLAGVLAVAVTGGVATAAPTAPKVGKNLVPNASFELSPFDPAGSATAQPLLPTAWSVEGGTLLFDHNERVFKEGKRGVAISGALSGGRQLCDGSSGSQECVANPVAATRDSALRPAWKTAAPVPVAAGKKYRFAVWTILPSLAPDAVVAGEGSETRVRWVGAGGRVLSTVSGPTLLKGDKRLIGWKRITADLVAPRGATGAVLLLGHSDYTTTSTQVAYDAVLFAQLG